MEAWMEYEAMLSDVFQQPCAYSYPFGAANLGWLYDASDETLRRLPIGRLRDQAVSVDEVFAEYKGRYLALSDVARTQGMTPYLDAEITQVCQALRRLQQQKQRVRAILDAYAQPRYHVQRN